MRRVVFVRWAVCGLLVLAAHALALAAFRPDVEKADDDAGGAVAFVDLAPEAAAPPAPPRELAPGPQQSDSPDSEGEQAPPPPVAQLDPAPPQAAAPEPPPPVQAPSSETAEEPVAPPSPTPVETPPPQPVASPSPEPVETPPPQPVASPSPEPVETPTPPVVADPDPPSDLSVPSAPPSAPVIAPQAVGPEPGEVKPPISPQALRWQRGLVAQIERFKRYPARAAGRFGVARVAFTIDRQGRLTDVRMIDSSGSAVLDAEAIATVRRAAPFPTPPDVIASDQLSFVVPIRYALSRP